jgi:cyclopropane-fatty-acyl-phospholipid synthase
MALHARNEERASRKTLTFLQTLLRDYHPRNFEIELWDGARWEPEAGQFRRFTWKINRPGTLRAAFASANQLGLAEAYIYGDFDIDGDIEAVFPLGDFLVENLSSLQKLRLGAILLDLPVAKNPGHAAQTGSKLPGRRHSKERDRRAVTYHYDVSNDFYRLWLDKNMVYSCAYFETPQDDLDTAQVQKLDYVCRKLRLQPGERLLDIGCGWGGLILHAVKNYGVHASGITLSQQQLEYASERIQREGLSDRCQVSLADYRDFEAAPYDKIASIGMVEHVGESNLEEYFRCAYRLLRAGGAFLNHGIGVPESRRKPPKPNFTDLYVFPDGELLPISVPTHFAERAGFEVRDVENLREHYALTLRYWVRSLIDRREEIRRLVDEIVYRIWKLQMAGSAYYFETGRLELYQTLLVKTDQGRSGLPLTRADWYA